MKSERAILSLIAVIVGLLAAGAGFYFFQMSRSKTPHVQTVVTPSAQTDKKSASALPKILTIDSPIDESVSDKSTIVISGKTEPNTTVVISSETGDTVTTSGADGSFSTPFSLDDGVNLIHILAMYQNGEQQKMIRTVTYSTESF